MIEGGSQIYTFGEFRLDVAKRELSKDGGPSIPLTPKVFDTLVYLVRHRGKVIEKDVLMSEIWSDSIVEENNLNQNISILRRVFGEKPGEQRFIVTVAGHGYRFVPEVSAITDRELRVSNKDDGIALETIADNEIRNPKSANRNRLFAVLVVLIFAAGAFYVWNSGPAAVDQQINTIAILPFKPLVLENRNEALELGLADALISKLSGSDVIIVRPLSSIRKYNSLEQDSLTAANELGVDSVLDGTIQNWGDRIRISATLTRTSDGKQLWSGKFDEKFTDIFIVQDTIAEKVSAALKIRLAGKERKHSTENLEAYQLYMMGRYNIAKNTPSDLLASIPFFEQAIAMDPGYALAYTGLAHAYGVLGLTGDSAAIPKARAAEQKALELDDTLGEAHNTRCMGAFWYDWDWQAAEHACLRSIEIDPNNADFHGNYAMLLSSTGRHAEALAEARRTRELNPLNLTQNALEGQFLLYAGQVDDALAQLRRMSDLEPKFWMPHMIAAGAYIEKGMFVEAIAEAEKERELSGHNVYPLAAYALAKSGKREEARSLLTELSQSKNASPYNVALLYNALDESDDAMNWLEKAFQQRDPKMTSLKVEPKWNNLRTEARFIQLMTRMNF